MFMCREYYLKKEKSSYLLDKKKEPNKTKNPNTKHKHIWLSVILISLLPKLVIQEVPVVRSPVLVSL